MARKSGKPKNTHTGKKIITIRTAFIPAPDSKGTRRPIRIDDAEGRMHQVQHLCSLEEDARTFVAGRTLSIAERTDGRWEAMPIPPAKSKTAAAVPQPAML